MKTARLFKKDAYLSNFQSKILEIKDDCLRLEETAFFPESGGQSSDLGHIDQIQVTYVFEDGPYIWHRLTTLEGFTVGQRVKGQIDWNHRFDNMQRHAGEHIMSGVWYDFYKATNTGFHMGEDYMTIDLTLDKTLPYTEITQEMLDRVELRVNEIIWENLPIVSNFYSTKDEAKDLKLRKELKVEEDITIVTVGSLDKPSDSVACCGTHPRYTGEIGALKIFKVEKNKGMFRLYFDAGKRALLDYRKISTTIGQLGLQFSAGKDDLIQKVDSFREKYQKQGQQLKAFKQLALNSLVENFKDQVKSSLAFNIFKVNSLFKDELVRMGGLLLEGLENYLLLYTENPDFAVLMSNKNTDTNCGNIVNSLRDKVSFKGGGGPNSAQLIFSEASDLEKFISHMKQLN